MTASYGLEICITHKCLNENNETVYKHDIIQQLFQEHDQWIFCCAGHKEL